MGWFTRAAERPQAPDARLAALAERLDVAHQDIGRLRAELDQHALRLPEYRAAMSALADRCDEVLDRADKRQKRAVEAESREKRESEADPYAGLDPETVTELRRQQLKLAASPR